MIPVVTSEAPAETQNAKASRSIISTNLNTGGLPSATGHDGDGEKSNSTKTTSKSSKHTMFNEQDPAGSVVMVTPAATMGTQLYKIGDYVTWGWNYTNLQGPPTAVDVLVSCSKASNTWTLTQNMTFETEASYTWDTNKYQKTAIQSPLLTEEYTLVIYDAESSVSATGEAGYLAPFTGFTFGLYAPQAYTPLGEWKCVTCSAGVSDLDRRAIGAAVAMSVVTVLSFTWFVAGMGALV